jgi:hypothetical protein
MCCLLNQIVSPSSVMINHIYIYSSHVSAFSYLAIIRGFIVITNSYTLYMSVIMPSRLYYKDVYKLKYILKQIKRQQDKIRCVVVTD